jgi:hypothetical protein
MSTAIAIKGWHPIHNGGYEPVSEDSGAIQHTWKKERNFLTRSASDWLPAVEAALRGIRDECRNPDWDGDGAVPVTDHVINLAARIAEALFALLPKGTPIPDLIPEADGEVCISWSVDATPMFSVSVGEHGKINFAGQFGSEGGIHAWQAIDETSPSALEESLDDVVRYVCRLYAGAPLGRAAY